MHKNKRQAFTLVELIVVITILAILGTIAFISFQGYSAQARDSKRVSDIQNIKKSLELFSLNTGKYPLPDNSIQVIYGGDLVWTQGIIGDNVEKNLNKNLNKKPLDPLTESEYTYSITNSQTQYELLSVYESDLISNNLILNNAKAANKYYPKIDGNYNQIFVKTPNYYVPTPSIINSEANSGTLILNNSNIKSQVISGGANNLAYLLQTAQTGGLDINLSTYTGSISLNSDDNTKKLLAIQIRGAYSGTSLANIEPYKKIIETPDVELASFIDLLVLGVNSNNVQIGCLDDEIDILDSCIKVALLKDINVGVGASYPSNFTEVNGKVFFIANDGINGSELWITDGSEEGTNILTNINNLFPDSYISNLIEFNGKLFFNVVNYDGGFKIWKSDGTEDGTTFFSENFYSIDDFVILTKFGGNLYFKADNGSNGEELWVTDGTEAGTFMLKDINVGAGDGLLSHMINLTEFNGKLYFNANDGINGDELWITDGTQSGTLLLKDINPGSGNSFPSNLTEFNGKLYFLASDGVNGYELWTTNGTQAGTLILININIGSGSSYPSNLTEFNGKLYFKANNGTNGYELWSTDGTQDGTFMLKDINVGAGDGLVSNMINLTEFNGKLYFIASDGINGEELWITDGTQSGTILLKDVNPGSGDSFPSNLTEFNGKLYFVSNDGTNGYELWSTDGTQSGTLLLKDVNPGSGDGFSSNLIEFKGKLYFIASDGINGEELWITDGTQNGTVLLKDINPGSGDAFPLEEGVDIKLVKSNNKIIFNADNGITGYEIFNVELRNK